MFAYSVLDFIKSPRGDRLHAFQSTCFTKSRQALFTRPSDLLHVSAVIVYTATATNVTNSFLPLSNCY